MYTNLSSMMKNGRVFYATIFLYISVIQVMDGQVGKSAIHPSVRVELQRG